MTRKIILLFLVISACAYYVLYVSDIKNNELPIEKALTIETQKSNKQIVTSKKQYEQKITLESPIEEKHSIPENLSNENEYGDKFDLYYFALEIHGLAIDGDPQKQFELAYTILMCESYIALRDMPMRYNDHPLVIEVQDWWLSRCAGFDLDNIAMLGDAKEWIEKSAIGGYAPAQILSFFQEENFIRTEDKLTKLHQAIMEKQHSVFSIVGTLSNNNETIFAWSLLSCDYGLDCSGTSKELWRIGALASCTLKSYSNESCDTNMTFTEYLKENQSQDKFQKIMNKKNELKDIIESGLISELTWEMVLD